MVDRLTKMTHFIPCKNESTAHDIAQLFVDNIWKHHGMPLRITTDRGPEFTNRFIAALCDLVETMHCQSTAYHPQSDGQTERMNRVLEDMLRHYVNPKQNIGMSYCPVLSLPLTTLTKQVPSTPLSTSTMASTRGCLMISL